MPRSAPHFTVGLDRARAHWHRIQGLAEPRAGSLEEVIAEVGWPRTLGGVDVYLATRARVPGMKRSDLDEAVAASRLQVIPAVRGCIYLVPRAQVGLVLRVAEELSRARTEREMEKVGITEAELAGVGEAVIATLKKGPLTTDALRKALPQGVVRSLGEQGKKVGISSNLPPALRHLEFAGKVERTLEGGRLDTERYAWRLTRKSPYSGAKVPSSALGRHVEMAWIFFGFAGPATVKEFSEWSGIAQRDARAAMDKMPLVSVAIEGFAEEAFVLEERVPALRDGDPESTSIRMVSFEDNYLTVHGGPAPLVDPKHHGREVPVWGQARGSTLGDVKHVRVRVVLDGDRVAGLWELDPDSGEVVVGMFDAVSAAKRKAIAAVGEDVARFLTQEIGHAKSFSLDTTDAVRERARQVRAMG